VAVRQRITVTHRVAVRLVLGAGRRRAFLVEFLRAKTTGCWDRLRWPGNQLLLMLVAGDSPVPWREPRGRSRCRSHCDRKQVPLRSPDGLAAKPIRRQSAPAEQQSLHQQ